MKEYLIQYWTDGVYKQGDDHFAAQSKHTMVVEAESCADAFVTAYDALTRRGLHVNTYQFGNRFARGEGEGNPFGMSDDEVDQIREAGVEFDESPSQRGTHIQALRPYKTQFSGRVVSEDDSLDPSAG